MQEVTMQSNAELIKEMARIASTIRREWNEDEDGKGYPQTLPSFDDLALYLQDWSEEQSGAPKTQPKHHAGPYGHDYYYIDGVLYAQPGFIDGHFTVDDDANLPVDDFVEPLTTEERAAVVAALRGCNCAPAVPNMHAPNCSIYEQ